MAKKETINHVDLNRIAKAIMDGKKVTRFKSKLVHLPSKLGSGTLIDKKVAALAAAKEIIIKINLK